MLIFVDKTTGTWGDASEVVILEASESDLEILDEANDSGIAELAENAQDAVSVPHLIELRDFFAGRGYND